MSTPVDVAIYLKAYDQTKEGLDQARQNLQGLEQQAEKTFTVTREQAAKAVTSMANMVSSAMNLYNAYDRIGDAQTRVASAEATLIKARVQVANLQEKLNKLVEQGKEGSEEYRLTLEQLQAAELRVQVASDQLKNAQEEVNKAYIQMALSTVPLVTSAIQNLSMAKIATFIPATKAAGVAIQGFMVSLGPIGLILMALTAAIGVFALAWANNWGGIREKVEGFCQFFGGIYENHIKPGLEAIKNGFEWLGNQIWGALSWLADKLLWWVENNPLFIVAKTLLPGLDNAWKTLKENILGYNKSIEESNRKVVESVTSVKTSLEGLNKATTEAMLKMDELGRRMLGQKQTAKDVGETLGYLDEMTRRLITQKNVATVEAVKPPETLGYWDELVRRMVGVTVTRENPMEINVNIENVSSEIDIIRLAETLGDEIEKKKGGL
ncbi:MAG: hypothetical protein ACKD6N_03590 [Candidatus Bathyarchaeota archaeon]